MSQFNFFLIKYVCMLKNSNIKRNAGRSASNLISVDAKYLSGGIFLFYKKYIVTIKEFYL